MKPKKTHKALGKKEANGPSRNLYNTDPLKEQFEPTDSNPIPQHKKMAGA